MPKVRIPRNTPVKASARQKLELSQLDLTQMQLMGKDVDLEKFKIQMRGVIPVDLAKAITDAKVHRTISGASTFTVDILDRDRRLLRSGRLSHKQEVKIDGLWFRLVNPKKNGDMLNLIFEDREIGVLRTYAQPIKASANTSRTQITRAQFVRRLILEPKEFRIPYEIPELTQVQPIGAATDAAPDVIKFASRDPGIVKGADLTVKGEKMSATQIKNANTILDVGQSMVVPRAVLVMAMMAAIQESSITNLPQPLPGAGNYLSLDPDKNPVGVFQQIKFWGWPASRDIAKDAIAFLTKAAAAYTAGPQGQLYALIEKVQNSGNGQAYAQWRTEAERIVNAYGVFPAGGQAAVNRQWADASSGSGDYEFYRGVPPVQGQNDWLPENSWTCIQRLASEVNWRAYFVAGRFYYLSDEELFMSKPRMRVTEGVDGVDVIDGDYDENKKVGTATVNLRMGRWQAPPGSIVEMYDMGPWDGRWIVTDVERSLFQSDGTITLEKPHPKLPEPIADSVNNQGGTTIDLSKIPGARKAAKDQNPSTQYRVGTSLVQPIPKRFAATPSHGVLHDTLGLPGYPAYDFWGVAGTDVVAPEAGRIVRFSGHDPALGPIDAFGNPGGISAAGGPLGWSIYLLGDSGTEYYLTHLDIRTVTEGELVSQGRKIGTVANYSKWGKRDHTHVGVKSNDTNGHPDIYDLGSAPLAAG